MHTVEGEVHVGGGDSVMMSMRTKGGEERKNERVFRMMGRVSVIWGLRMLRCIWCSVIGSMGVV